MKKAYIFCFIIFLLVHGSFAIFAQPCATQTGPVTITITIPTGINNTHCFFTFSPALAPSVTYNIYNGIAGDAVNGSITIGGHHWTNDFNYNEGYYVQLDAGNLYIRKNPTSTGTFGVGDALTWTFTISNIIGSYEITSVTATNGATAVPSPCNVKPTVAGITSTISTTAPLAVQFSANTPIDSDGTVDHYLWSFGGATTDGLLTEDRTNNLPFTKTYTADGSYTVTLQVMDNDGALSDSTPATPAIDDPVTTTVNTNQRPLVTGINATISTTNALAVQFSANMPAVPDPDTGDTIQDYVWDFGGATTDGLTTETKHNNTPFTKTYTADGSFPVTLRVTDDKGLSSDSRDTVLILAAEPTLIYEFNDDSYAIYPVPANDAVYVEYHDKAGDNKITVQLYDLYGKLVLTDIRYEKNNVAIDVSGMPTGIYCLTVHCGNGTKTYKIPKL